MNKQLTAMQDLICICNKNIAHDDISGNDQYKKGMIRAFQFVKEIAVTKLLSKEKEQIQLAYHDGFMKSEISYLSHTHPIPQVIQCTEEYYQNTYQNN